MDVVEGIKGGLHMADCRLVAIGCQERVDSREIRTRGGGQPTNTADEALVGGCTAKLSRRIILIRRWSNGINGHTRPVRSSRGSLVAGILEETLNKIGSEARLIKMNRNGRRGDAP
jgi:hypothetical protein